LKLHPEDRVATRIVARIDELFSIDAEARSANLDQAARHLLRLERARPLALPGSFLEDPVNRSGRLGK
jgi:hypothetical protein